MIFFPDNRDLMPDLPVRQIYFLQESFAEIFRSGCLIKERNTASVLNHIFDRVHISNGCNMPESFDPHSVFRQGVFQDPSGAGARFADKKPLRSQIKKTLRGLFKPVVLLADGNEPVRYVRNMLVKVGRIISFQNSKINLACVQLLQEKGRIGDRDGDV